MRSGEASRPTTRSRPPDASWSSSTAFSPVTIFSRPPGISARYFRTAAGMTRAETVGSAPTRTGFSASASAARTASTPWRSAARLAPA